MRWVKNTAFDSYQLIRSKITSYVSQNALWRQIFVSNPLLMLGNAYTSVVSIFFPKNKSTNLLSSLYSFSSLSLFIFFFVTYPFPCPPQPLNLFYLPSSLRFAVSLSIVLSWLNFLWILTYIRLVELLWYNLYDPKLEPKVKTKM